MKRLMMIFSILAVCWLIQAEIVIAEQKIERGDIEWCDMWIPNANQNDRPRILLVGDSITKGYYGEVVSILKGKAYCAKFATSACVADSAFHLQLKAILSQYHWDIIHFNNGLHGFWFTEDEYLAGYEQATEIMKTLAPGAKLIITLSTPLREPDGRSLNSRVDERNRIAMEMAQKVGVQIDDLYSISKGHPEYYRDTYHYKPEAIKLQAKQVVSEIEKCF